MPKLKYIKIKPKDFKALIICAVRYAIGRRSYMPSWIADIVRQNRHFLDPGTVDTIIRDIVNAPTLGDDAIDMPVWVGLKNQLEGLRRQDARIT